MKRDASLWKRFFALLIDLVVIDLVIVLPFAGILEGFNISFSNIESLVFSGTLLATLAIISLMSLLYFSLMQYFVGKTIGAHIFKLELEGKKSFGRCLLRNLFVIPFFPFYLLWIIEPIHLLIYHKRFLDRWTKMKTVEKMVM